MTVQSIISPLPVYSRRAAAFSLIELSVVLVIIAVVLGGVLTLVDQYHKARHYHDTADKIRTIEEALQRHLVFAGHLPCPAPDNAAPDSATFGVSYDCSVTAAPPSAEIILINNMASENNVMIGSVPTRSLNLPDDYAVDAWNVRFRYAVVAELALSADHYRRYEQVGGIPIIVNDQFGNSLAAVTPTTLATMPAYILMSFGKDTKGAVVRNGTAASRRPCNAGFADSENCDDDRTFIIRPRTSSNVANADRYDDMVVWKSQYRIDPELRY